MAGKGYRFFTHVVGTIHLRQNPTKGTYVAAAGFTAGNGRCPTPRDGASNNNLNMNWSSEIKNIERRNSNDSK